MNLLNRLPEMTFLEKILDGLSQKARVSVLETVSYKKKKFPIYCICIGSQDPQAPTLGVFGGVHGLERIGAQVALSYLHSISELMEWDELLHDTLKKMRIVFLPIANPVGMYLNTRGNGNGVDLMRNAPVESEERANLIVGGQRLSRWLPNYRGPKDAPMELEALAMIRAVDDYIRPAKASLALDIHSGFGFVDRIWFPHAKSRKPFPDLAHAYAIKNLMDHCYPHHVYLMEPQSRSYTTNGDLWDYMYDNFQEKDRPQNKVFLPLTLEMGSWSWLKKSPAQLFSVLGRWNPMRPHRHKRILRRHIVLLDFFMRFVYSHQQWENLSPVEEQLLRGKGLEFWYGQ